MVVLGVEAVMRVVLMVFTTRRKSRTSIDNWSIVIGGIQRF